MQSLQRAILAIRTDPSAYASLPILCGRLCDALRQASPSALQALNGRYRLQTADTDFHLAFSLSENGFALLDRTDPVDVTITGVEAVLLALVRGEGNPARAMLTGKLKVRGDLRLLSQFAQIL